MHLVNLTKQALRLHDTEGVEVEIPPDPRHVALTSVGDHRTVEDEKGRRFSVNTQRVRGVKGMPEPRPETLYVVTVEIAMALQRDDVVFVAEDAFVPLGASETRRISHLRRLVLSTADREPPALVGSRNGEP